MGFFGHLSHSAISCLEYPSGLGVYHERHSKQAFDPFCGIVRMLKAACEMRDQNEGGKAAQWDLQQLPRPHNV